MMKTGTTTTALLPLGLSLLLAACGEDEGGSVPDTSDSEPRYGLCGDSGEHPIAVMQTLMFARKADGISDGFDLDGYVSTAADAQGCNQQDLVAPDGREGIDNQFGELLPLLEAAGGEAFETYVQDAINRGGLLLMLEIEGMDDPLNDDCVNITLFRGEGLPFIGTDELIAPAQSFDIATDEPWARFEGVEIIDGVIDVGPFDYTIPFYIFDFVFFANVRDAYLHVEIGDDRQWAGRMGGGITIENMLQITEAIEGGDDLPPVVESLGRGLADLRPDSAGDCQALSVSMGFETTAAFVYEDSPKIDFTGESGVAWDDVENGDAIVSDQDAPDEE